MAENKDQYVLNALASNDQHNDQYLWLITFSDMMSLILVFFIMLFAVSVVDTNKFKAIASSVSGAFGGKSVSGSGNSDIDPEVAKIDSDTKSFSMLVGGIKKLIEDEQLQGKVEVALDYRGVVLYANGNTFFKSGEIEILDEAKPFLEKTMKLLQGVDNKILIEGHTDDVPIRNSKFNSNWELSTGRATSVVRYFMQNGGLVPERLSAAGYAEFKPRYPHSAENRAKNRRVEIIVLRRK